MKNKQSKLNKLKEQVEKLEAEIKLESEKEKLKFQTFIINNKEIRIYKWEEKPFKEFPMPKDFDWCDYKDFIDLANTQTLEFYPIYYYMKNPYKYSIEQRYELASACLNGVGDWGSSNEGLADSNGDGRVVISKDLKVKNDKI